MSEVSTAKVRPTSIVLSAGWLSLVTCAGLFAPLIANERPIWISGVGWHDKLPALAALSPLDVLLLVGGACLMLAIVAMGWHHDAARLRRHMFFIVAGLATGLVVQGIAMPVLSMAERRDPAEWVAAWRARPRFVHELSIAATLIGITAAVMVVAAARARTRWWAVVAIGGLLAGGALALHGNAGRVIATTPIPAGSVVLWAPIAQSPQTNGNTATQLVRAEPGSLLALPLAESLLARRPISTSGMRDMAQGLAASSLDVSQQKVLGSVLAEIVGEGKPAPAEEILRRYAVEEFVRPPAVVAFVEGSWRGSLTPSDLQEALGAVSSAPDLDPAQRVAATGTFGSLMGGNPANPAVTGSDLAIRIAVAIGPRSLLGTDSGGRDVAAQMIHGARTAIGVGVLAVALALLVGVPVGALMGWRGGSIDLLGMRVIEVFKSIPNLLLLIVAASVLPRSGVSLVVVMALCMWPAAAKYVRAEFLRIRELDYVAAARAAGVGEFSIVVRHMLPGALAPVIVNASFAVGGAIIFESTLSYLGLGPSGVASWGALLAQAIDSSHRVYWWLAIPPGLAIFLTVYALHVLGDYARERIDPRLAG